MKKTIRIKRTDVETFKLQFGTRVTSAFLQILEKLNALFKSVDEVTVEIEKDGRNVNVGLFTETSILGAKLYVNRGAFTFEVAPRIDVVV